MVIKKISNAKDNAIQEKIKNVSKKYSKNIGLMLLSNMDTKSLWVSVLLSIPFFLHIEFVSYILAFIYMAYLMIKKTNFIGSVITFILFYTLSIFGATGFQIDSLQSIIGNHISQLILFGILVILPFKWLSTVFSFIIKPFALLKKIKFINKYFNLPIRKSKLLTILTSTFIGYVLALFLRDYVSVFSTTIILTIVMLMTQTLSYSKKLHKSILIIATVYVLLIQIVLLKGILALIDLDIMLFLNDYLHAILTPLIVIFSYYLTSKKEQYSQSINKDDDKSHEEIILREETIIKENN